MWLLGTAAPLVYGGGAKDAELSRADALIAEKRYDEAILVLSDYIRENPDKFSLAQKRLRQINRSRDQYNVLANELLDVLVAEPDNTEKILDLSRRMEALDTGRGSSTQEFLARMQQLAQFTHNRNQLEQILANGREQIAAGHYLEAIRTYEEGLELYQDEFFREGYGELVESRVREGLKDIDTSITGIAGLLGPLSANVGTLEGISRQGQDISRAIAVYVELRGELEGLITAKTTLERTGNYFTRQLELLQQSNNIQGDRSFLSFASYLIFGPPGEQGREGMIGAISTYWNSVMPRIGDAFFMAADRNYRDGLGLLRREDYAGGSQSFRIAGQYIGLSRNMEDIWNRFAGEDSPKTALFGRIVPETAALTVLRYEALDSAAAWFNSLGSLRQRYGVIAGRITGTVDEWRAGRLGAESAETAERSLRESFAALMGETGELIAGIDAQAAVFEEYYRAVRGNRIALEGIYEARQDAESLNTGILGEQRNSAVRQYTILNGEFEKVLTQRNAEFTEAARLIGGISREAEGDDAYISRYPAEGLIILTEMSRQIEEDIRPGEALLAQYGAEPPFILASVAVTDLQNSLRSMIGAMNGFRSQGATLAAAARAQASQAEALRLDGNRLYQEAQAALARNNFNEARDRVLRSGERYDASLGLQESASLRQERDSRLISFGAEITRRENEYIVREVRELVNEARNIYFQGNFTRAEELLVRAQNRRQITNVERDPEVTYWLTVVRGALSLRSGRSIPATAPLFPEMSQLLSDARRNYEEGARLLSTNRRREGLSKFTEARQKTQEVRLMFPVNQEASLLELRIDQVTDPAAFTESFQRRFTEAVAGTKQGSPQAFADLQDLAQINPRYPGIANAVTQAEIDMGYRPRPPDARALARSNELTVSARAIINQNVRAQFPIALEQLNQALSLNPNNGQAMSEKDRVQTLLGGAGTVILSNTAEREYQRAVQELQQGNAVLALSIVQQLLQAPENRGSTRLLELQRRIESIL
jgi:hypothetical protein